MTDSVSLLSTIDVGAESRRTEQLVIGQSLGPPSVLFMLQQVLRNQLVILQLLERLGTRERPTHS